MDHASTIPSHLFILESINDAVIVASLGGTIQFSNSAAQRLFGYTKEEFLNLHLDALVPENRGNEKKKLVESILWGARIENYETERLRKDKSILDVSVSLSSLKDDEGKSIGLTAVIRDISDKKQAEGKFQAILESAPDAMVVINKFGQVIFINNQTQKLFGYDREQIIGQEIEMLMPARFAGKHVGHRAGFFLDPNVREMGAGQQLVGKKSNGEEFPAEIMLSPLETEEGIMVSAAIRDITDRKKAEERIKQSEEKFIKAFELSPGGILMSKVTTGEIIDVNDRFLEIVGFAREEVIGHSTVELKIVTAEVRKEIIQELEQVGYLRNREILFTRKSGEHAYALFSIVLITLKSEKVAFSMYYDITERKKSEAELKQKSEELVRSNKELEQFAYIISHDLQAPLRSITNYITLIEKRLAGKLDDQLNQMFGSVVRAGNGMKTMITELLSYASIGKGDHRLEEEVDCNTVVNRVLADLDFDIRQSKATVDTGMLPMIKGNQTEIKQLFQNLVSNAIKFRRTNVTPEISIRCDDRHSEWEFSVRDNGIGISEEFFNKLFLVFQRLHGKSEYPGSGIGLATCKKIVDILGGRIWVTSKQDVGTVFHFTVPKIPTS